MSQSDRSDNERHEHGSGHLLHMVVGCGLMLAALILLPAVSGPVGILLALGVLAVCMAFMVLMGLGGLRDGIRLPWRKQ